MTNTATNLAPSINIWSGAQGLGGALTNMSERAREKGKINHPYPVKVLGINYVDAEQAYQKLKHPGGEEFNDGLMVDIIALKFHQHPKLAQYVKRFGGAAWLKTCDHFVGAKSKRGASWEGAGMESRFIRNLVEGYEKFLTGRGSKVRVVHVNHAPYDVYIGRGLPNHEESIWHNPFKVGLNVSRQDVLEQYDTYLTLSKELQAQLSSLQGKTLGCWCVTAESPEENCHGHIIAAHVEGREWDPILPPQGSLF